MLGSLPASSLTELDALLADAPAMAPRGAVRQLWHLPPDIHEVIVAGPAETGKTFGCCQWLHEKLQEHRGAQAVLVRNAYADLVGSAVQTYTARVLRWETYPRGASPDGVTVFGGNKPEWFDYPNGSRLWLAGMDNPGKALSSERDYIYANQAEELARRAWETLLTRATGRAGNVPHPRVFGDCNPGAPTHWILGRAAQGRLLLLHSRHEDNPTLYDDEGQLTAQGRRTLAVLDGLTGIEYRRLRLGEWVSAEGTVYQLLPEHLGDNLLVMGKPVTLAIDPSNGAGPYACLVLQEIGERVLVVDEFYRVGAMDEDLADWLRAKPYWDQISDGISDPAKPDTIARLSRHLHRPVRAKEGRKDIVAQINAVKSLLALDPVTKRAPLVVDRDRCPMLVDEFANYAWRRPPAGTPDRNVSDVPEDAHNHCLDALAYWTTVKRPFGHRRPTNLQRPPTRHRPAWA